MSEEIWKDIAGYEGYYQVSTYGRVRSLDRMVNKWDGKRLSCGRILSLATNLKGYQFIYLCKDGKQKMFTIHRLVATAFIPNPNGYPHVNHIDENKMNNRVENLEWCTARYNNTYGNRIDKVKKKMERGIVAYDKNGSLIGRFKNFTDASRGIGLSKSTICGHAKRGAPTQGGIIIQYQ